MIKDEEIIKGCIKGNPIHQQALYKKYAGKMMGVCVRYVKSRAEAEDVFQESFVKVFKNIASFRGENLEAWMKKIFVNGSIDRFHKNKKYVNQVDYEDVGESNFEVDDALSNISMKELLEVINKLPEGYKVVFNLYVIEGYTHKEVGEMLGITEGTSKSQLSKAKKHLQKIILTLYPKVYEHR